MYSLTSNVLWADIAMLTAASPIVKNSFLKFILYSVCLSPFPSFARSSRHLPVRYDGRVPIIVRCRHCCSKKQEEVCNFERIVAKLTKRYGFGRRYLEFLVYLQHEMIKVIERKRILKIAAFMLTTVLCPAVPAAGRSLTPDVHPLIPLTAPLSLITSVIPINITRLCTY